MSKSLRQHRFVYRLRLAEMTDALRRWPDDTGAHLTAALRRDAAARRLRWWQRLDIDLADRLGR
ncbi:hypothetical protein [Micromonospora rubida]|uniref:hypothetical protein n=1 Tax=Micromonospora rubida TaxID=2697657 RepID=UPI001377B2E1|nr:hypothetical protein [Micromonospora rubida]NBE80293.1 hypothetical protein [Micromonospora rubida]